MKNFLLRAAFFLAVINVQAQQAKWFKHKNIQGFEHYEKTKYIPSQTHPFIISQLEQQMPTIPNAQPIPPKDYLTAYDTSGTELWTKQVLNIYKGYQSQPQITALISKQNDKFWMVVGPGDDSLKIGNQYLSSPYHDSLYLSYYFVEMDRNGSIISYLVKGFKNDINFFIIDAAFDGNGDFILGGIVRPNLDYPHPWSNRNFAYGNYTATLTPEMEKHFVAKFSQTGTEGNIFQFNSSFPVNWTFSSVSHISKLGVNSINGDIVFIGMLGDTLSINGNTMINTTQTSQLFLGRLDANLNYLSSKSETVASSGTFLLGMAFNPVVNAFYFTGSWDTALNYGQQTPLIGSAMPSGNDSYLAKLQSNSLNLDVILPIFAFPHTNGTLSMCYGLDVAPDGSVFIGGLTEDSIVDIGPKRYHVNNPNWYEVPFVSKLSPALHPDTTLFGTINGTSRFNAVAASNSGVYCSGSVNGSVSFNGVGGSSTDQLDAMLVRIDMKTTVATGIAEAGRGEHFASIRPNPSAGYVNVWTALPANTAGAIRVTNLLGELVLQQQFTTLANEPLKLDLQEQKAGVYFVTVYTQTKSQTGKLILSH